MYIGIIGFGLGPFSPLRETVEKARLLPLPAPSSGPSLESLRVYSCGNWLPEARGSQNSIIHSCEVLCRSWDNNIEPT